jgi:V8-like Glu-specific endopeptidase
MRARLRAFAAVAWVTAVVPLTSCAVSSAAVPQPSHDVGGAPATRGPDGRGRIAGAEAVRHVGALFHAGGPHFCSGTVIAGATADLVVTAAHCVTPGPGLATYGDLEFAPGYARGSAPYGRWRASRVTVDPRWTASADPDLDVAFVELAPRAGQRATDLLGTDRIGFGPAAGGTVRLTGYPKGGGDAITCLGTPTRPAAGQLRIACTGYGDGTSGSPWLADFDAGTGTGTVVGVIGGYQLGGDTDDVSYSSYFGDDVRRLYQRAVAG